MPSPYKDKVKRQRVISAMRSGEHRYKCLAEMSNTSVGLVGLVMRETGGVVPKFAVVSSRYLSTDDRIKIATGIERGNSDSEIAQIIGKNRTTVWREISRNGGRKNYGVLASANRAEQQRLRPKVAKLVKCKKLRRYVQKHLLKHLSPMQISGRLMIDYPDDPAMQISHEAIYQSLFIQSRGALKAELTKCLRTGRAMRRPQKRTTRTHIKDKVMISDRPAEIEDRAIPGHWEGDLIIGKDGLSAIGTLVERSTRFVMLMKLSDKSAETLTNALKKITQRMPEELFKSLTWDQGKEMAYHSRFSIDCGIDVYFCNPHSPWERGSNENTNGLLRQYFPKGTPLNKFSQAHLDKVARELNERPRQTLKWMTPAEKLNELLQ
jgi:IS30 family transposase